MQTPKATSPLGSSALAIVLFALFATACDLVTAPALAPDAVRFTPPAVYARWWAMTEGCAGTTRNIEAIRFYHVAGNSFRAHGDVVSGVYTSRGSSIVIAEDWLLDGGVVRHEMLHAISQRRGHPRDAFLGSCAGIVECEDACVRDAGPWPHTPFELLAADSLIVRSDARISPADADGNSFLEVWVTATNPRDRAVLASRSASAVHETFGTYLQRSQGWGASFAAIADDTSRVYFAAGESKRWLFEFQIGNGVDRNAVPPGDYLVRGSYGRKQTALERVVIP